MTNTPDTISDIVNKLKSFVGDWSMPVVFAIQGRAYRVDTYDRGSDAIVVQLTDKKVPTSLQSSKSKRKHPKNPETTSEWALAHFNWDSPITGGAKYSVDVLRNQLQNFFNEELMDGLPLPRPGEHIAISDWVESLTVKDIKGVLDDLDLEIVRLTAVRDMVIATKREIKKEMNS